MGSHTGIQVYRCTGMYKTCIPVHQAGIPVWLYTFTPVHLHACALLWQYAATVRVYRCVYVLVIQVCQPGVPVYRYCTYLCTFTPACVCSTFAVCSNCTSVEVCVYVYVCVRA